MISKVVGIKNLDFVTKEGNTIKGKKIQLVRKPTVRESDVEGQVVDTVFINHTMQIDLPVFKFGNEYDFIYETDGKHSYLIGVKAV